MAVECLDSHVWWHDIARNRRTRCGTVLMEATVAKISFSVSVYEHAASLIGRSPWDVSRDEDLLWRAHREAYLLYRHFPIVVGIDIYNLEAEAYGCQVERPSGNGIPAITRPLFRSLSEALNVGQFDSERAGRIPMVIRAARRLAAEFPEADVRVPVSGPFSIATSLLGADEMLMSVAAAPDLARQFLLALVPGQVRLCEAARAAGLDVAFFESAAAPPLLSPTQFGEVELPALKAAMTQVGAAAGHPIPCIIGGDTEPIVEQMLETGTDFVICPAETNREKFMRRMESHPEVKVRVNLDPRIYSRGTPDEIIAAVDEVIALAAGRPNILLGTGAVPYETPPGNILLIRDCVA
jgi:uroporphyrinogen decarboxylase